MQAPARQSRPMRRLAAFTLLELLVVMGILLILAVLTTISVGKITRDAKLANATNTIVASLGTARAIAVRDNTFVMVTFRIAPDRRAKALPREPQVVQVVTARWTGESIQDSRAEAAGNEFRNVNDTYADRFLPVPGVPMRDLPAGVMVAGPAFGFVTDSATVAGQNDRWWRSLPRFAGTANYAVAPPTFTPDLTRTELGWAIGVLFGPDGRVLSRMPGQVLEVVTASSGNQNAYVKAFVDYDGNGFPNRGTTNIYGSGPNNLDYFVYDEPLDEPLVDWVPYLAVFNDAEARQLFDGNAWKGTGAAAVGGASNPSKRVSDQTLFIEEQADRITFNRYTGVAGVVSK